MKIGFIGSGRVGSSFGKYLKDNGINVLGYFDLDENQARRAATQTDTLVFTSFKSLIEASDMLFLTVPDDKIAFVAAECATCDVTEKFFCHCSGVLSSEILNSLFVLGAYTCSVHPLCAVSNFGDASVFAEIFFTIEGSYDAVNRLKHIFIQTENPYKVISKESKIKYHAAAVFVSNMVCGLVSEGEKILAKCGFTTDEIQSALMPLFLGNAKQIARKGPIAALTGPVERNDWHTVEKHIGCLDDEEKEIYILISRHLAQMVKEKYPERDDALLKKLIY